MQCHATDSRRLIELQTVLMAAPVQGFLIWRCWTVRSVTLRVDIDNDSLRPSLSYSTEVALYSYVINRCATCNTPLKASQVSLLTLLLAQLVSSIIVTVQTFQIHFGVVPQAEVEAGPLPKVPVSRRPPQSRSTIGLCSII